jgi:hypothetical protein
MNTPNVGRAADPEPQGYDLIEQRPGVHYDPFGDGTRIYSCTECDANWNADDLHMRDCSRLATYHQHRSDHNEGLP